MRSVVNVAVLSITLAIAACNAEASAADERFLGALSREDFDTAFTELHPDARADIPDVAALRAPDGERGDLQGLLALLLSAPRWGGRMVAVDLLPLLQVVLALLVPSASGVGTSISPGDYRFEEDDDFAVLGSVMTAPLVVTHWITSSTLYPFQVDAGERSIVARRNATRASVQL